MGQTLNIIVMLTKLFFQIILFIYLSVCSAVLGPRCCVGFSLAAATKATLVVELGLLYHISHQGSPTGFSLQWILLLQIMGSRAPGLQQSQLVTSIVATPRLQSTGSQLVVHGLSYLAACEIFPCFLHLTDGFFTKEALTKLPFY